MKLRATAALTLARKKDKQEDLMPMSAEDAAAGTGIVALLSIVALAVVALIAHRSMFPPAEARINVQVERDERSLGVKQAYPVELLSDNNGTAALQPAEPEAAADALDAEDGLAQKEEFAAAHLPPPVKRASDGRIPSLGNFYFSDAQAYEDAPDVVVPPEANGEAFKGMWGLLNVHEKYFMTHKHKRYIPRLAQQVTREEFHEVFHKTSTPVIVPFEYLRKLGFLTRAQTVDELRMRYPYLPPVDGKTTKSYNPGSGKKGTLDIGPAVFAISKDAKLEKIAVGVRNYPRNLQLSSRNMYAMDVSRPPFIDKRRFQAASMWFGTSSSDTKFHHDCCDNFVMMVAGTKRWFIAPPTDWRSLMPIKCEGGHQSLCWASVPYPLRDMSPRDKAVVDKLNHITIDIKAGEMLYLPAGWWQLRFILFFFRPGRANARQCKFHCQPGPYGHAQPLDIWCACTRTMRARS